MHKLIALVLAALLTAASAACNRAGEAGASSTAQDGAAQAAEPVKPVPAELPDVLARVNGEDVRKSDFDMLIRNMELSQGPIPPERRDEILRGALDRLITYTLLQQEARNRKIAVSDTEVDERLNAMRGQFASEEAFQEALGARGLTLERLREDARIDMVITRMLDEEVATAEPATDEDVRQFYDANPDRFRQDEAVRASHILILVDADADDETKNKARARIDGLLKRARAGEDFAALAREHSEDGSAAQGGDLDFFTRGRMVPEFEQAAFALQVGEISDVVTTQYGYHIIKATDRRPEELIPLETVRPQVQQYLTNQKKQEHADAFIAGLKDKARIEVLI